MSKKKKTKKKSISILNEVDKQLTGTYENIMEEIQEMQLKLNLADQKARKKIKKMGKKKNQYAEYRAEKIRRDARKEVIEEIEGSNFLDKAMNVLKDLAPIVVLISRVIASLITAILSVDRVKLMIKPETLDKLNRVYQKAMSIS